MLLTEHYKVLPPMTARLHPCSKCHALRSAQAQCACGGGPCRPRPLAAFVRCRQCRRMCAKAAYRAGPTEFFRRGAGSHAGRLRRRGLAKGWQMRTREGGLVNWQVHIWHSYICLRYVIFYYLKFKHTVPGNLGLLDNHNACTHSKTKVSSSLYITTKVL